MQSPFRVQKNRTSKNALFCVYRRSFAIYDVNDDVGIGNEIFEHGSLEIRDSAERSDHSAMALPTHSQELCFSTDVFLDENFNVDEFVSQCRKRVTIECLREDLESYFRTLKSAMVELINKDYADFVNLSSNLVRKKTIEMASN